MPTQVALHGSYIDEGRRLCLLLEYCSGGDLHMRTNEQRKVNIHAHTHTHTHTHHAHTQHAHIKSTRIQTVNLSWHRKAKEASRQRSYGDGCRSCVLGWKVLAYKPYARAQLNHNRVDLTYPFLARSCTRSAFGSP
jgi:hypothetical protein